MPVSTNNGRRETPRVAVKDGKRFKSLFALAKHLSSPDIAGLKLFYNDELVIVMNKGSEYILNFNREFYRVQKEEFCKVFCRFINTFCPDVPVEVVVLSRQQGAGDAIISSNAFSWAIVDVEKNLFAAFEVTSNC